MELYFLSVGYGEAIVLLDGTHCLVIDGGAGGDDLAYQAEGTIRLVDFLHQKQVQQIDCILCTHLHNDHVGGLADVAEQFPIRQFWINFLPEESAEAAILAAAPECAADLSLRLFTQGLREFERLRRALTAHGISMRERTQTEAYEPLWPGCEIRLFGMTTEQAAKRRKEYNTFCTLNDPQAQRDAMRRFDRVENTCSLACSLKMDNWCAMLTGDLCSGWEARCQTDFPSAALLKLTHHGQKDGMPQALVEACDPSVFLMCADAERTFQSACDAVKTRARGYLQEKERQTQHIYTTGRLVEQFGEQDGMQPCALCCTAGDPITCTAYYAKDVKG